MATTIRISDDDKVELEKLQAEILLSIGEKLSYPELLHVILKISQGRLKAEIIDSLRPPQAIDWEGAVQYVSDWGFSNSDDIDDIVYGE